MLVTGGAGYIGGHVVKSLSDSGHQPIVLDNLSQGDKSVSEWCTLVRGDIGDKVLLKELFNTHRIAAVIHLAAYAYTAESLREPAIYFHNNVANTLTLLDAMIEHHVSVIVVSSTCATYALRARSHGRLTEVARQDPINPYGESKLMMESVLKWYARAYGLRPAVLRYFNAAGADPGGAWGEAHNPEFHLIPRALAVAQGTAQTLELYGADYDTADGTAIRDYVHVSDLARGHITAVECLLDGHDGFTVNLGTGRGWSVAEVVTAVERVAARDVKVTVCARRKGDPPYLVADPSRARAILNWIPTYTDIETIVATAWHWQCGPGASRLIKQSAEVGPEDDAVRQRLSACSPC